MLFCITPGPTWWPGEWVEQPLTGSWYCSRWDADLCQPDAGQQEFPTAARAATGSSHLHGQAVRKSVEQTQYYMAKPTCTVVHCQVLSGIVTQGFAHKPTGKACTVCRVHVFQSMKHRAALKIVHHVSPTCVWRQDASPILVCEQGWRASYDFALVLMAYAQTHTAAELGRLRVKRASFYRPTPLQALSIRCSPSLLEDGEAGDRDVQATPTVIKTLQECREEVLKKDRREDVLTALEAYKAAVPAQLFKKRKKCEWHRRIQEPDCVYTQMSEADNRLVIRIEAWQRQRRRQAEGMLRFVLIVCCFLALCLYAWFLH